MYRAFDLNVSLQSLPADQYEVGLKLWNDRAAQVRTKLETFVRPDGSLDGSEMQTNWFPQVPADIFISHSHQDQRLAITLAGWLSTNFGLRPFIDSCVWGNCYELLKIVDDEYCRNPDKLTYSYEMRNGSTSHVHMMLSAALAMMIDNAECSLILNTKNSITSEEAASRTKSPWIYSEIATMQIVQKRKREEHRHPVKIAHGLAKGSLYERSLEISHTIPLGNFEKIDVPILRAWLDRFNYDQHPLDLLYRIISEGRIARVMGR